MGEGARLDRKGLRDDGTYQVVRHPVSPTSLTQRDKSYCNIFSAEIIPTGVFPTQLGVPVSVSGVRWFRLSHKNRD